MNIPFTPTVGLLIKDLARLLRVRADQHAGKLGMSGAQWTVLAYVRRMPGIKQAELAALIEVEPITIGRLVDKLEGAGLLERRNDPADRRVWQLFTTEKAQPVLAAFDIEAQQIHQEIRAGIDDAAIEILIDTLQRIKANLTDKACASRDDAAA